MTVSYHKKSDVIFIFLASLLVFTLGLSQQEIISFEARFYVFALEMWRHGVTWFPTTYQKPYPDYPVTSTLLIYAMAKLFGGLNKFTAVLPSAIASAFVVVGTYLIGVLHMRRWGWYAAGMLLFTLAFVTEARTISLDAYVATATTFCFYFSYRAKLAQKEMPLLVLMLLLIFGFAMRGPIGLVIPASVLCVFYLLEGEIKDFFVIGFTAIFLLCFCSVILLTIAYHAGGEGLLQQVLRMEVLGRMQVDQTPPFYFYFKESMGAYAVSYPLAVFMLLGLFPCITKWSLSKDIKLLQIAFGWALIILVGLSVPADKKVRYILAVAPALALISSYLFMATSQYRFLVLLRHVFVLICAVLPSLSMGLLYVFYKKEMDLNYGALLAIFIILQLAIIIIRRVGAVFCLALITFLIANIFMVEKINLATNQTRVFVRSIETLRAKEHAKLVFYQEGTDGLVIKYLADMPQEENPIFIMDAKALPTGAFIIAQDENYQGLPANIQRMSHVIHHGKLGHDSVVVFVLNK